MLGLGFVALGCGRSPSMSVVELAPSRVSHTQLPRTVSIRGHGLTQTVSLSLDDKQPVAVIEPVVTLGETELTVLEHTVPEELQVWVEGLPPGSYDLRIGVGEGQTVLRDAFRVLGDESDTGGATDVYTSSGAGDATSVDAVNSSEGQNAASSESVGISASAASESETAASFSEPSLRDGGSATMSTPESDVDASAGSMVTSPDASSNAATAEPNSCLPSSQLFFDDFESGDFEAWTSYDTTGSCQTSGIASGDAVSGSEAFQGSITCSSSSGDHENYGALQFSGDAVRTSFSSSGTGIDAPHGIVIDFWARASFDFEEDDGEWLAFLVLAGACDWSDTVFSVGTGNATSFLAISHVDSEDTSRFAGAQTFPQDTWTKVTAYVNYHTGNFIVWQDGTPITQATFERPGTTLCHVRIGAYVSGDTDDARVRIDDPTIWKLETDLGSLDTAPCMTQG